MMKFESAPDLSFIPAAALSDELRQRHVQEAQEYVPMVEHVAQSDGLAPLLNLIVSHALPLI